MVPYGLCFMVSLRLSVPAQNCVKAVLEALKRYLSTVIDLSLGLKMRMSAYSSYPKPAEYYRAQRKIKSH